MDSPPLRQSNQLRFHVVLLNDNDHSFAYVIRMLEHLFGCTPAEAWLLAQEVHTKGRAVVDTTFRERAEMKVAQIQAFGPDPLLPRSQGPVAAILEPAKEKGDPD